MRTHCRGANDQPSNTMGLERASLLLGAIAAVSLGASSLVLASGEQAKPVLTLRNANHPSISADGGRVAVAPEGGVAEVYQVSPKKKLHTFRPGGSRHWLSADGRVLATNGDSGLYLWDVDSGQELAKIAYGIRIIESWPRWLWDEASFSSDLSVVADEQEPLERNGRKESGVSLWDLKNRKLVRIFSEEYVEKDHWRAVSLSPDGRLLAASRNNVDHADRNATVVWDTQSGREILRLPFNSWWVALSSDGHRLVTSHLVSGGGEALIFSVTEQGKLRVERAPGQRPLPPSHYLMEVWDIQTGGRVSLIGAGKHTKATGAAVGVLSPDGKLLATSSLGYIVLWNADTGELLTSLPHDGHIPPREGIRTIAFSGDGGYLVTGSEPTEVVKVWRVADLLALPAVEPQ